MDTFTYPLAGQTATIHADGALADVYRRDPLYTEVLPEVDETEADQLKGKALTEELKRRGLSTHGTVAEKRARLSDAPQADAPDPTANPSPDTVVTVPPAVVAEATDDQPDSYIEDGVIQHATDAEQSDDDQTDTEEN